MDSLHVLPLSIIPLETPALHRARLIKNVRLESVVELFADEGMGSGQIPIEALPRDFNWPMEEGKTHPDLAILRKLALLPSYDVYSLRIALREHGIAVGQIEALKLSPEKAAELSSYMTAFTRPLIAQIYGGENLNIEKFEDIVRLFRDPDIEQARKKLQIMADKLQIQLVDVPRFLEDYGDIFLSLSYYRQCLDRLTPLLTNFIESLYDIRKSWQLKQDINLMNTCAQLESRINNLLSEISGRFENFDRSTKEMWDNISAERFSKVKALIESYHTTIGGVLCALTVKMNAWAHMFPNRNSGGPVKRGEFILSEMKQGFERIKKIESDAPMLAELK